MEEQKQSIKSYVDQLIAADAEKKRRKTQERSKRLQEKQAPKAREDLLKTKCLAKKARIIMSKQPSTPSKKRPSPEEIGLMSIKQQSAKREKRYENLAPATAKLANASERADRLDGEEIQAYTRFVTYIEQKSVAEGVATPVPVPGIDNTPGSTGAIRNPA
jgi:hypothetical protein